MPKINPSKQAIGIFDSGLGGLTVVKEVMRRLPHENIVYFGDTARVPYGTKSKESIIQFSIENAQVLLNQHVKMIVVACNSCSSYAINILKKKFTVPILGVIEPGAKKAVEKTRNKKIGVIATTATIASNKYEQAIRKLDSSIRTYSQPCPLFVPLVEEGWASKSVTLTVANEYLSVMKKKKVDTVILGCTHYPLLKSTIKKAVSRNVILIDSASEVAAAVDMILNEKDLRNRSEAIGYAKFLISDRPQQFEKIARKFLGSKLERGKFYV